RRAFRHERVALRDEDAVCVAPRDDHVATCLELVRDAAVIDDGHRGAALDVTDLEPQPRLRVAGAASLADDPAHEVDVFGVTRQLTRLYLCGAAARRPKGTQENR